jgi:5'-methylthioadenosine phosphorylase
VGIVTDYDCWLEDPSQHVTVSAIFELYRQSLAKARALLEALLDSSLPEEEPEIRGALQFAMLTPPDALSEAQREWFEVLRR